MISGLGLLLVGALLGQLTLVQAQTPPKQYTECFSALTWVFSGAAVNEGAASGQKPNKTTRIPSGWTPVGGGGTRAGEGIIIICR